MRSLILLPLLIIGTGAAAFLGLPWWMTAVGGALAGILLPIPAGRAFSIGFSAGYLLWWGSAFFFNAANGGILAAKMGELFSGLQAFHLLLGTGVVGGLLGGLGALTGVLGKQMISHQSTHQPIN